MANPCDVPILTEPDLPLVRHNSAALLTYCASSFVPAKQLFALITLPSMVPQVVLISHLPLIVPNTVSFSLGVVVPIPTLPAETGKPVPINICSSPPSNRK